MEKRRRKTERTHRVVSVEQQEQIEQVNGVTLEMAMKEFLQAKSAERAAERTIKDYQTHFRYLCSWLEEKYPNLSLVQITAAILREYVTWMSSQKELYDGHPQARKKRGVRGLSPMTVNVRIRTMRAFFHV